MRICTTWVLALCALFSGCATAPSFAPIPGGEAVSITVVANPKYPGVIDVTNTAVNDGLTAGVGTGGVVGGLWGLTCGPFAVLCVPLGAVAGVVAGGAAGAAVGATGILSKDKQDRVKDRLVHLEQTHPLLIELKRNLDDRAGKYWTLNRENPATRLTVEIQELQVAATRDERLSFVMRVLVSMQGASSPLHAPPRQKRYEYTSPFSSMAVWLDEPSDFLDTSFTSASQQIAAQIVSDLAVK